MLNERKDFYLIVRDHEGYQMAFEGGEQVTCYDFVKAYETYADDVDGNTWKDVVVFQISDGSITDITEEMEEIRERENRDAALDHPSRTQSLSASDLGVGQYGAYAR